LDLGGLEATEVSWVDDVDMANDDNGMVETLTLAEEAEEAVGARGGGARAVNAGVDGDGEAAGGLMADGALLCFKSTGVGVIGSTGCGRDI